MEHATPKYNGITAGKPINTVEVRLKHDLAANKLSLNIAKTEYLLVGS